MAKTIYLASPYGVSQQQRATLLPPIMSALKSLGLGVWEPFHRNNQENFADVVNSDATFAVVNGVPPDEGVMVELGMAIALGKLTFLFRDDFRRATDREEYPLNLMLFTGMPEDNWRDYYNTALDEITAPDKVLTSWVRSR